MGTSEEEGERNLEYFQGQKITKKEAFKYLRKARVIIIEVLGLRNSYPRRLIPTDLRVWLERVYLLGI